MVRYAAVLGATVLFLSSCGTREKEHLPVVVKIGAKVKAISESEAETLCQEHECETNQLYSVRFGRKRHNDSPPPQPIREPVTPPGPIPSGSPAPLVPQPLEADDYSRQILRMGSVWAITEGSREIVVAVIDTGVSYTHPDLRENIWVNSAEQKGSVGVDDDGNGYIDDVYGWDFYNNRPNGFDDGGGHGTHVAGIIGALRNGIGIRGISPRVKIMPVKFLGRSGGGDTADAISAIQYAVKMGAHVLSNSWGGGGYSRFLETAIEEARAQGILVVAAAGNSSADNDVSASYPANYAGVISVGSTDASDQLSPFSNYGRRTVMILAPGSEIRSTYVNDTYRILSGTSMAAPQVSGALALALALRPQASESSLRADLCDSSVKRLLSDSVCGRMDVGAFLQRVTAR